ncbi:MAG TPA: glycosyltransferase family 39 protein [Chthoniobacteraceae bacterium]
MNQRPFVFVAILFVLAVDIAFAWQRIEGPSRSEFGGHPDEAAHYVTGLMFHDYFVAVAKWAKGRVTRNGLDAPWPGTPLQYGNAYYAHYPKIGLGVWPPVFYLVQSAWTLPFGVSRGSLLALMCALTATDALLVYVALRRDCGILAAMLGGLLFTCLPLVREFTGMVMAEMLSTAFMFGATLVFGEYLDRERPRDAVWFGFLAALAILTKGTGVALGLMAFLAIALTRRWHLLAKPSLWISAAITAVLAGPWTWIFRNAGKGGWEQPHPSLAWTRQAIVFFVGKFGASLSPVVFLLFCAGVITWLRLDRKTTEQAEGESESAFRRDLRKSGRWAALAALVIAVIVFQSVFPAGKETRHLIPALAAGAAFALLGFVTCARAVMARLRKPPREDRPALLAFSYPALAAGLALIASAALPISDRSNFGFAKLAEMAVGQAEPHDVMLVSSDAVGEGMFIAEVAQRDAHRPGYFVRRSSKELAASEWNGSGYRQKFRLDEDLLAYLASGNIHFLVVDQSMPEGKWVAHHTAVASLVNAEPSRFWLIAFSDIWRDGEENLLSARLFRINPLKFPPPKSQ